MLHATVMSLAVMMAGCGGIAEPEPVWPVNPVTTTGGVQISAGFRYDVRPGEPLVLELRATNPNGPPGTLSFKRCAIGVEVYPDSLRRRAPLWDSRDPALCPDPSMIITDGAFPISSGYLLAASEFYYPTLPQPPQRRFFTMVLRLNGRTVRYDAGAGTL